MDGSILLISTFLTLLFLGEGSERSINDKIDNYVNSLRDCKGVTGMSVTLVQGDKVIHKKGYGYADTKTKRKVKENTRFCVASLTKAFTATLLATLLDDTGYDWDTPISMMMPGVIFPEQYMSHEITLRDILSHKVGFPSYDVLWMSQAMPLDEMLRRLRYLEPKRPFRTDFTYSNLMFILAGKVAEHLGHTTWEVLMRDRILKKLGMNETGFAWEAALRPEKYAKPHKYNPEDNYEPLPIEAIRDISASQGAASICSTANDMAKWMRFLLNRKSSDVIKATPMLEELFKAQTALREGWNEYTYRPAFSPGKYVDYGLGWFTGNYRGYQYHDHYGFISEYFSHIALLPDKNIAVFASVNGAEDGDLSLGPYLLNFYVMDTLLNEKPFKNADEVCAMPPQERSPLTIGGGSWQFTSLIPFDPYIGRYGHPVFGNVSIFTDPNTEELFMKYGRMKFRLELDEESEEEDRFKITPVQWWGGICSREDDHVQFSPYEESGKSLQVSIPCFENLPDMYFERDLKISDIEKYSFQENPSLQIACVRGGSTRGQVFDVVLLVLVTFLGVT